MSQHAICSLAFVAVTLGCDAEVGGDPHCPPAGALDDARVVAHDAPASVATDATFICRIELENTGETVWRRDGYRLAIETVEPWGEITVVPTADVMPGDRATFEASVRAPSAPGRFAIGWRMEGPRARFGDATPSREIEVSGGGWPSYPTNPFEISLAHGVNPIGGGGIFTHDLDLDGLRDYVVTAPGHVSAYDHDGALLWHIEVPIRLPDSAGGGMGYPGIHGPGAGAGDTDGDGREEVLYIGEGGWLYVHDALTGEEERRFEYPGVQALAVANLRGMGDREVVLQIDQTHVLGADATTGEILWDQTDWYGLDHSQVRAVDVDGDGLDEVVGSVFLESDGTRIHAWDLGRDHGVFLSGMDSLAVGDIVPGGLLEVALAETGTHSEPFVNNDVIVISPEEVRWIQGRDPATIPDTFQCAREKDPDKIAIGDFDPARPGLEIFARSACAHHPWVHGSTGEILATWNVADTAPAGWYLGGPPIDGGEGGIDIAVGIDWRGDGPERILVTERDVDGRVAIVDAMTGAFEEVFDARAIRMHAADVSGDHREEILIVEGDMAGAVLRVIENAAPAGAPRPRRWTSQRYRRVKQVWNYYSP